MTCLTCHATKSPKIFKEFAFILPLEEISKEGTKIRKISHEKNNNLGKSCVTMTDLMDKIYETTELSDVICDNCTKSSITTRKSNFEKKKYWNHQCNWEYLFKDPILMWKKKYSAKIKPK